jgi:hypothetical protein
MMQHVNLIIATPGHSLMTSYVKSLLATAEALAKEKITWLFTSQYSSHVADAREVTLSGSMENSLVESRPLQGQVTYDKIMWIDSDIAWNPEDIIKLYKSDKDIVSGAYLLASGEVTAYKKILGAGYTHQDILKMKKLTKIDGAGFGFICVKQGVFESLSRPWFQQALITKTDEETGEEFTFPLMGEDISWCHRVKQNGYQIWLDPTVRVQHHKMMKLTWDGPRA